MCKICFEWQLGKLTTNEAWRNLNELATLDMSQEELDHYWETAMKLADDKQKNGDLDE
jgi:hypothetical protein